MSHPTNERTNKKVGCLKHLQVMIRERKNNRPTNITLEIWKYINISKFCVHLLGNAKCQFFFFFVARHEKLQNVPLITIHYTLFAMILLVWSATTDRPTKTHNKPRKKEAKNANGIAHENTKTKCQIKLLQMQI